MEIQTVRWSPAAELLELCCGYEPKPPDAPIDLDYMEHLVKSYERWEGMECYNDLLSRIKQQEARLESKWKRGEKVTPQEQGAAMAFDKIRSMVEFNRRRLQSAIANHQKMAGTNGTRASERIHERMNRE